MSAHEHETHHVVPYHVFITVWIALLVLTGITVWVSRLHLGAFSMIVALAVASIKAGLVITYFMHMKYEKPIFRLMLYVAFLILAIFIGFTFFDVLYR